MPLCAASTPSRLRRGALGLRARR